MHRSTLRFYVILSQEIVVDCLEFLIIKTAESLVNGSKNFVPRQTVLPVVVEIHRLTPQGQAVCRLSFPSVSLLHALDSQDVLPLLPSL